jgi:hypothetical protein
MRIEEALLCSEKKVGRLTFAVSAMSPDASASSWEAVFPESQNRQTDDSSQCIRIDCFGGLRRAIDGRVSLKSKGSRIRRAIDAEVLSVGCQKPL